MCSTPRTPKWRSTCRRWSTCAWTPKISASGSERRARPEPPAAGAHPGHGAVPVVPRRALPERQPRGSRPGRRDRQAHAVKVGIVGLPNAGKSSLFNPLTGAGAQVAGYAFTTVAPNGAVVAVPDERLDRVAEVVGAS